MMMMTLFRSASKKSPWAIALLALCVAAPAFAQGGGGRTGRTGNQESEQENNGGGRNIRTREGNEQGGFRGRDQGPGAFGMPSGGGGRSRNAFSELPADNELQILTRTSIFARNRVALEAPTTEQPTTQPREERRAGPTPAFIGVIEDNGGYVAFLDNANGPSTSLTPVKPGDRLQWNGGTVREVSMDKLKFELNGQTTEVSLGHNLRNEPVQPEVAWVPPTSLDRLNRGNYPTAGSGNNNQFGRGNNGNFGFGGNNQFGGFGGGGRGGRGNNNFNNNNNFGNNQFGQGNVNGGGFAGNANNFGAAAATTPVITNDPPLPAGTTDDLEARLRARRAQQVGGGGN